MSTTAPETHAPETYICFSCSKAMSRTVLASLQCMARLHALISPKRWRELDSSSSGYSIELGHYIGKERDLPVS